jgi:hypothetical protein
MERVLEVELEPEEMAGLRKAAESVVELASIADV